MRRILGILVVLGVAASTLTAASVSAAGPATQPKSENGSTAVVAIAIGQLKEDDGDIVTFDLRAGKRDNAVRGNLRFYCPKMGYYNGGVRTLEVKDGVIKVSGGGSLIRPDGTRKEVHYQAQISSRDKSVNIKVQGKGDFNYTMEGTLDPGLVKTFTPEAPKTKKAS